MSQQYTGIYILNGTVKDAQYATTETFCAKTNLLKCLVCWLCKNIACETVIESLRLF